MAEEREKETTIEDKKTDKKRKAKKEKKKSKKGLLFLFMLIALPASLVGLHLTGTWDARPMVYSLAPKIPYIGEKLVDLLDVPPVYTMTVEERRMYELRQWEDLLGEREKKLNELSSELEALSSDLATRGQTIKETEEKLATKEDKSPEDELSQSEKELFDSVVKTYQEISSRRAAKIVENLDPALAVKILRALPEDEGASILGRMDAPKAAWLTEQLVKKER